MRSINKVIFIGRLGADPELKHTSSGSAVTTLSVATSKSYKKDDEWVETTQWHRVVLWRGLAEFASERLHKGSPVYIEGELRYRTWEDDEGNPHKIAEVVASTCNLLADGRSLKKEETETPADGEEIPF